MKERKLRKVKAFTRKWWKEATDLRLSYAPKVGACNKCNRPTLVDYCCESCGSGSGCHYEALSALPAAPAQGDGK